MHGTELCSQNRRVLSLQLPAAFVGKQRFNASGLTCQLFRLEPASRSGLSLSRNDCPLPGHHFEVKAPDLLLRSPAGRSSCPFGLRFPHALRFAPVRARSIPKTRCLTYARHPQPFLGSPLPFRAFRTLPDQSVQPDFRPGSSPSESARLPLTPQRRLYFISSGAGSTFQARFAFSGLLFLKPLGTNLIMHPHSCYSQMKNRFQRGFSSIFIPCVFMRLREDARGLPVEKTGGGYHVLGTLRHEEDLSRIAETAMGSPDADLARSRLKAGRHS